jgi:signal transduction histidine kinase
LAALQGIYAAILTGQLSDRPTGQPESTDKALKALMAVEAESGNTLQTAELEQALTDTLRELWSPKAARSTIDTYLVDALALARDLISRVGDDSKLAIDPDLDGYYLQSIVVRRLPSLMGQLGETHTLFRTAAAAGRLSSEREVRLLMLDGLLRSTAAGVKDDLAAAYRGNTDGALKGIVDSDIEAMVMTAGLYLSAVDASLIGGAAKNIEITSLDDVYGTAVDDTLKAWATARSALDRLLRQRIDNLTGRLYRSLGLIAALACLGIVVAIVTHRRIVRPLERLESVARTVHDTKNYGLRIDYRSRDEIGRLATAFNERLAELAVAREREIAQHSALARASQLTTVGEMAASIAHEINQPLAAIATNGKAGLRWLERATPDLDEAKASLKRIVSDAGRAIQVIGSIRSIFKKGGEEKVPIDINEVTREVLTLVHLQLQSNRIIVRTQLDQGLPRVLAGRVQLQQVIVNLITNAIEARSAVTDRERVLRISSEFREPQELLLTVEDSGIGIESKDMDRVFERFFTTKQDGMGMGLAICRSIVEAYNGRLWAEPAEGHGSIFRLRLPAAPVAIGSTDNEAAASAL